MSVRPPGFITLAISSVVLDVALQKVREQRVSEHEVERVVCEWQHDFGGLAQIGGVVPTVFASMR
jgi:hypothetical protein